MPGRGGGTADVQNGNGVPRTRNAPLESVKTGRSRMEKLSHWVTSNKNPLLSRRKTNYSSRVKGEGSISTKEEGNS